MGSTVSAGNRSFLRLLKAFVNNVVEHGKQLTCHQRSYTVDIFPKCFKLLHFSIWGSSLHQSKLLALFHKRDR